MVFKSDRLSTLLFSIDASGVPLIVGLATFSQLILASVQVLHVVEQAANQTCFAQLLCDRLVDVLVVGNVGERQLVHCHALQSWTVRFNCFRQAVYVLHDPENAGTHFLDRQEHASVVATGLATFTSRDVGILRLRVGLSVNKRHELTHWLLVARA